MLELLWYGKALQQLQDKAYAEKYRSYSLPIHLIGVEFSREALNVVRFGVGHELGEHATARQIDAKVSSTPH